MFRTSAPRFPVLSFLLTVAALGPAQPGHVHAQWVAGPCPPVGGEAGFAWRTRADDPERLYLFHNHIQVGGYDSPQDQYRPYDAATDRWGEVCQPPTPPPSPAQASFFGVDRAKLKGGPRYTITTPHGEQRELTRDMAHAIVARTLEDDSGKYRITVIGPNQIRQQVIGDLAGDEDLRTWAIVRGYPPDHWAVQSGFVTTGKPTIYCQAPSGKVVHRQDDYQGGAEVLREALRKVKPLYDPKNDPDLRFALTWLRNVNWQQTLSVALAALVGAGTTTFLSRRK